MQSLSDYLFLQSYLTAEQWISPVVTFTRPANTTAYVAPTTTAPGYMIGQSTTAASCSPLEFDVPPVSSTNTKARGKVAWARLRSLSSTGVKSVRMHLVKTTASFAPASGDGAAISLTGLSSGAYLGSVDINMQPEPQGGAWGQSDLVRIPYELDVATGEKVFVFLEALTAFTPTSAGVWHAEIACDRTS